VWIILQELFRNDDLLADAEETTYSARADMQDSPRNRTGFELFSDRVKRMYPDYILDDTLKLMPGPDAATVNFDALKSVLLSKDLKRVSELAWTAKALRFLDGKVDLTGNRICLASFPRTGTVMLRKYMESISGIHTGSDMSLIITNGVQMMGMAGENHVPDDGTVWVTKSHWPSPPPPMTQRDFTMDRAIVLVRNPIDVMSSMFLFINTGSHSMTCKEKINEAFPAEWDEWIHVVVAMIKEYYEFIRATVVPSIPVFFCRYEDITINSKQVLSDSFRFMLNAPDIAGTVLQHKIDKVTAGPFQCQRIYKLKSTQTLNRCIDLYTQDQKDFI